MICKYELRKLRKGGERKKKGTIEDRVPVLQSIGNKYRAYITLALPVNIPDLLWYSYPSPSIFSVSG
jgi:hypothetical protein